jgi:RNA-binding protein
MVVIQCDPAQLPRLYSEVLDRRTRPIGKLTEIFGNIKAPYAAIFCKTEYNGVPGEKVFAR